MRWVFLALFCSVLLIGCSTEKSDAPTLSKPRIEREDFSKLSNDQLCELSFDRKSEDIDEEIYVRNLYCDPVDIACRKQGFDRNSLAMVDCAYKEKLKNQSPNVRACFDSGISKDDINGMTNCLIATERTHNIENHDVINYNYEIVKDK